MKRFAFAIRLGSWGLEFSYIFRVILGGLQDCERHRRQQRKGGHPFQPVHECCILAIVAFSTENDTSVQGHIEDIQESSPHQ